MKAMHRTFIGCLAAAATVASATVCQPPASEEQAATPAPAADAPSAVQAAEPPAAAPAQKNYDKPGFVTLFDKHGRLWVFRADSKELAEYRQKGELAKHVVRPRSGPDGLTLKAPDAETLDAYLKAE